MEILRMLFSRVVIRLNPGISRSLSLSGQSIVSIALNIIMSKKKRDSAIHFIAISRGSSHVRMVIVIKRTFSTGHHLDMCQLLGAEGFCDSAS
jgi:hypothetical protein